MKPDIDVLVDIDASVTAPIDDAVLQRAMVEAMLAAEEDGALEELAVGISEPPAQVGLRITDDDELRHLNKEYRGVDAATDVLSFSFLGDEVETNLPPGHPLYLGDVAISYSYAQRQAADLGHSVTRELAWLAIHGMLQILGYAHSTQEDAEHMEALEQVALGALHLPDD